MDINLLCLMQVWMNETKMEDTPKFLTENPTNWTHALYAEDSNGNDMLRKSKISLNSLHSVTLTPSHRLDIV